MTVLFGGKVKCFSYLNIKPFIPPSVDLSRSGVNPNAEDGIDVKVHAGNELVETHLRPLGNGLYSVSFKPVVPLIHRVHVLCHGYNAKGCPFDLLVTDNGVHAKDTLVTGSGLYLARCARSAGFTILTKGN